MGKQVTKAQLMDELAAFRERADALSAEVEALRTENEALRKQVAAYKADGIGSRTSSPIERVRVLPNRARIIHEFDPDLPGDYLRAMQRARDLGGVVRRKQ